MKKNGHHIQVYSNGDLCSREISAAGLLVRYFDEKMKDGRIRIGDKGFTQKLQSLGITNHNIFGISNYYLKHIVPIEPRPVYKKNTYKRPMLFVLKEGIMEAEKSYLKQRKESMYPIQRCAFLHNTGYKFIDYQKDAGLLMDGDIVIYHGPRGKEQCDLLTRMGYKLKVMSLQELKVAA